MTRHVLPHLSGVLHLHVNRPLERCGFGEWIQWFHANGRSIRVKENMRFQKKKKRIRALIWCVNLPVAKNLFSMKR